MQMATELELRQHRCCFTGHRMQKLNRSEEAIRRDLEASIRMAIAGGYTTFITGMAYGVDIIAGEVVLSLKKQYPGLKLIAVVPFQGVEARWDEQWIARFYSLLHQADYVKTICDKYTPDAYQKRNKWMVDHSNRVIAVFNGEPSGTKTLIDYALKKTVPVELLSA